MVVFLCSYCNASLRKNIVEKHFYCCRGCTTVSCMDCHKDFDKISFKSHTSCLTEEEKYDKLRVSQSKAGSNKQQQWTSLVQEVISKTAVQDPLLCQVMQELQSSENLPRKKQKFLNFMRSKYRRLRPDQVEQIWEILDTAASGCKSGVDSEPPTKRRNLNCEKIDSSTLGTAAPSFSFTTYIRRLLKDVDGALSLVELKTKLYSVYKASVSTSSCRLSSQEFEQRLLDAISSRKSISYSEADGMVRLLTRTPNEDSMQQGVDLALEVPTHIAPSGTKVETLFNGSVRKTLSDWVVDILQANGGHLRLKKLHKQLLSTFSNEVTATEDQMTMEQLQHRLEKRLQKATRFTLSDDGKFVMLIQNGTS
ncbi:Cell growth-regulating nucleolar protein [Clonorchis sinensis]|uniref:Cell growth-regulating nucleolar protein n=1 Tax=Clonorchis sinensis TaxID=79923 RepID=A0A8T1MPD7_CLOSI|nr:Cell growth-regulating nucleolar protein [Clonorchis sinensis]